MASSEIVLVFFTLCAVAHVIYSQEGSGDESGPQPRSLLQPAIEFRKCNFTAQILEVLVHKVHRQACHLLCFIWTTGKKRKTLSSAGNPGAVDTVPGDKKAPVKPGKSCGSCNQVLICKPFNLGVLKKCLLFFPHCNNGKCSRTPASNCIATTTTEATATTTEAAATTTKATATTTEASATTTEASATTAAAATTTAGGD